MSVSDQCQGCDGRILWMPGGMFWLHRDTITPGHEAVPVKHTELKPFTGCRLHRPLRPDECDRCKHTELPTP